MLCRLHLVPTASSDGFVDIYFFVDIMRTNRVSFCTNKNKKITNCYYFVTIIISVASELLRKRLFVPEICSRRVSASRTSPDQGQQAVLETTPSGILTIVASQKENKQERMHACSLLALYYQTCLTSTPRYYGYMFSEHAMR